MSKRLECGTSFADITPNLPVEMAGMGLGNYAKAIESPLGMRVFSFRQGKKGFSLVTCDLLGVDIELAESVKNKISSVASSKFSGYEMFISCSHNHWGPAVMNMRSNQKTNQLYRQFIIEKAAECVLNSFEDFSEVELSLGRTHCEWNINRRVMVDGEAFMLPLMPELTYRANGPVDHEVTVAAFRKNDGKFKAILFNYGCHPIAFPIRYDQISSEFPGETARTLGEKFGCLCGFTNGAEGDTCAIGALQGASTKRTMTNALVEHISELIDNNQLKKCTNTEFIVKTWHIDLTVQQNPGGDWIDFFSKYDRRKKFHYPLGYFRIGDWAAGLVPSECTVEPTLEFKKKSKTEYSQICSLTNGYLGYMLYKDEYLKKGYEPTVALLESGEAEKVIKSLLANAE